MPGVLDQEEIDALMQGLSSGDVETETVEGGGTSFAKYDFAKQDYAIRRLIPAIAGIQSLFADALKERLGALLPSIGDVGVENIAIVKYDEWIRSLPAPCSIAIINAAPLPLPLYLVFEPDLVYDMVDRYFGGRSRLLKNRASERFSATELRFLAMLGQELVPDISASWQSVLDVDAQLAGWKSNPRYLDDLSDTETLIATRFTVALGELGGGLWLIVPWSAIDAVRESLGNLVRVGKRDRDARWHDKLQRGVEDAPLEVVAKLAESTISLRRAARFKVGDIIAIDSPDFATLEVEGVPMFGGAFGTHQGRLAVKVEEMLLSRDPRSRQE